MIGLDLKCLEEFVHMGNEVKKLILLKARLSLPYQDLGDNETRRKRIFFVAEIFTVMVFVS